MDFRVSIPEGQDYVLIEVFKPITSNFALEFGCEARKLGEEFNLKKFLFDVRGAPNIQSVAKNYVFAYKELPEIKFPKSAISAFLLDQGDDSHEFIELAFKNAGYTLMSFTRQDEAIEWLKSH
ncbi:hypothetical protein SAMN05660860_03148 [Geoalkalibacter ferrihydriticus]|uniref:STAS/SEC14 domain-containing protein n=2 Tax=Geoalkalibacter ferrihydriticus TaxID=392333 RepID=A0A0C2HTG4_9BACT|nr:hypothetical protein [Geoalkalibacter ferrihydriticus]KIH78100.1 hypothetical protein GFER_05840 [Geoalkalibacter ferrihydriticus DSM 17813]SDM78373.1 hypothetical protein SAMN05660860_03148 [Geoalkalibacter ferrihydriticus]